MRIVAFFYIHIGKHKAMQEGEDHHIFMSLFTSGCNFVFEDDLLLKADI